MIGVRLYAIPHAGGSAVMFRDWQDGLGPGFEVVALEPPGRGQRFGQPLLLRLDRIVADLFLGIDLSDPRPIVLFGHSMGAVVAYEIARLLEQAGVRPAHVVVSGHEAPDSPRRHDPVQQLPDVQLLEHLARIDGLPPAVAADPELVELLLPIIRADLAAVEQHQCDPQPLVRFPITALGGADDHLVSRAGLAGWRRLTRGSFRWTLLPGGHFYLDREREALLGQIRRSVAAGMGTGGRA